MSFYINIDYGTTAAGIRTVSERAIAIIGRSTGFSGIAYNVQSVDELSGAVSSDPLYQAVENALEILPSTAMVIAAGLPAGGTTYDDLELVEGPDFWYSEYSPVDSVSDEQVYVTDLDQISGFTNPESGWYTIVSGLEWEEDDGVMTGIVRVDESGLVITDGTDVVSGYMMADGDKLRADITVSPLSEIFKELSGPQYRFQFFLFAYPEKETPVDPSVSDDFKFASGYCIGGKGWLDDIYLGKALAGAFNRLNQRTMFIASLPDGVYPDTAIGSAYLEGTSVSGVKYADLPLLIQSDNVILVQANVYQPETYDPALQMAGTRMDANPRRSCLFLPPAGGVSLETVISQPIINKWRTARINVVSTSRASDTPVWHGNFTMSSDPHKGDINYKQCINLLAYDLEMALYGILYSPNPIKYDLSTMDLLEQTIKTVCLQYTSAGIIDGYISTTIPIRSLLAKEGSLTPGEQATLDAARASGVIDNVTVAFYWAGDVETINITLYGTGGG